jgi:hypothetical protein
MSQAGHQQQTMQQAQPANYRLAGRLLSRLGFDHLTATVKTVRADVVTQMGFASGWLYGNAWCDQSIVRAVHTALGRGLFVLLNCHVGLLSLYQQALAKGKS